MTPLPISFILLFFSASLFSGSGQPIARRHDIPDSLYLKLGKRYPSVVRIGGNAGTGTLVAPEWVLTAGHVAAGVARRSGVAFKVFVDGRTRGYDVRQVVVHPDLTEMGPHDIALIRLARPIQNIEPADIYRSTGESGSMITLVGYGDTKRGTGGAWVKDGKKRGATNIVDDVNETHIVFDFDAPDDGTELEGTSGPGDSGGPAFIDVDGRPSLAGISSLGEPGRKGPGTYGAKEHYVRVSAYAEWVDGVLKDPPPERLVNIPKPRGRQDERPLPPGVVLLREIGLLVKDVDGTVRMVGRIDELFPKTLLDGGIRPPAEVVSINGNPVSSTAGLRTLFDAIGAGETFTMTFMHKGKTRRCELMK